MPHETGPPPMLSGKEPATVTQAGNIFKVATISNVNTKQTILRLPDGENYIVVSTGEIKEIQHTENRAQNINSLRRSFDRLRMLVNANTSRPERCRFVTLTYRENMTDPDRLYTDFDKFIKRFRYFCDKQKYGKPEFIAVPEPQARGSWHLHIILIFFELKRAPFIPNDTLARLWGHGFVHVRALDNIDNPGAYLTAYLGDIELPEGDAEYRQLAETAFEVVERQVEGKSKKFIKGGRLCLYPTTMNLYRCSCGVKRPTVRKTTYAQAMKLTEGMTKTYEKTTKISKPECDYENTIYTQYFSRARKRTDVDDK